VKNRPLENFEAMLRNRATLKTIEFVGLLFHYLAAINQHRITQKPLESHK
jgi:hypothetical protein